MKANKGHKRAYVENKVIELINMGYGRGEAENIAEEWWEEVNEEVIEKSAEG